jgi:hypothetical protein
MPRFLSSKVPKDDTIPVETRVIVVGGTNINHYAVILGITDKMYHIRLDNGTITKAKHFNVKALEASNNQIANRPAEIIDPGPGVSRPSREPSFGFS